MTGLSTARRDVSSTAMADDHSGRRTTSRVSLATLLLHAEPPRNRSTRSRSPAGDLREVVATETRTHQGRNGPTAGAGLVHAPEAATRSFAAKDVRSQGRGQPNSSRAISSANQQATVTVHQTW